LKRLFSLLLVCALLVIGATASGGDPNIEGGDGDLGHGTGESYWLAGLDGVRVSVMQGTTAVATFDLSNRDRTVQKSFAVKDKLYYKRTQNLVEKSGEYSCYVLPPSMPLPTIIPSGGGSNIAAIRSYFTDEGSIRYIASRAHMAYEELISGDYKLLLEPIAYFKFQGVWWAMTATEAALYDTQVSGALWRAMWSLTHQNLPLCMFLERNDLGISAWTGATTGRRSNIDILKYLGAGVVSFRTVPDVLPDPPSGDYVYRCDTDVITSVLIPNNGEDMTPDSNDYVTFHIGGTTYQKQIICPEGSSQLVWVKWHTPSTPHNMTITVTPPSGGGFSLNVSIVDLEEKVPPNPEYDGPGEGPGITGAQYRPGFSPQTAPDWGSQTSTSWTQWVATWEEEWEEDLQWVWVDDVTGDIVELAPGVDPATVGVHREQMDFGEMVGWWEFSLASFSAHLSVDFELVPDDRVPTAVKRGGQWIMASGYGVDAVCEVSVTGPDSYTVTKAQNVLAVFPEFDYTTYDRLLVPERNAYSTTWGFKTNPYSYYGEPVHFTPLWYPDGDYTVAMAVFDVWTPGGMLYATVKDTVTISGDMYDDWYIRSYTP